MVAWRDWLERHAITQPFKQAHREVYLLTDAERTTGTYSNRFAAHIVRQHQFHSLAAVRGWRASCGCASTTRRRPPPASCRSGGCAPSTGSRGTGRGTARTPPSPAAICGCAPTRSASTRSAPRRTRRTATAASTAVAAATARTPSSRCRSPTSRRSSCPRVLRDVDPVRGRGQCGQRPDVAGRRPRRPVPRVLGVVRLPVS
ncbi:DUF4132 domain-containing protein [Streptomyces sp. KL116D]|uniref:DUF4132 domain-containing protein n=1 Tax=Streptomyces sp. KL116D TaxID=3045152 RepID=UPI0035577312